MRPLDMVYRGRGNVYHEIVKGTTQARCGYLPPYGYSNLEKVSLTEAINAHQQRPCKRCWPNGVEVTQ